jgi:uncharacterized protein
MSDWEENLIEDDLGARALLRDAHRLAVLGIKPEDRLHKAAFYVPRYLHDAGYEIVPVPVYYPQMTELMGQPVYRKLVDIPGEIDMVVVFRRPQDIPPHVPDIIAKKPGSVWFQLGIRNDDAARQLAEADIKVVQDRCTMIEHRRVR